MKTMTVKEIIENTGGKLYRGNRDTIFSQVITDSRDASPGCAFFTLIGERFDGHDFINNVVEGGCDTVVVSEVEKIPNDLGANIILVEDTLKAYQDLAAYYRQVVDPVTIGITGSIGKTSLKDMLAAVFSEDFVTVWSDKNENNHIGVPKTIFRMEDNTEVLILEMGMSGAGEIHRLAEIGKPDVAVISNVGISHRENFDDDDGILNAKMEIVDYFEDDNVLVINGDDEKLVNASNNGEYKVVMVGANPKCDIKIKAPTYSDEEHISFILEHGNEDVRFVLPVPGLYNSMTAALTAAVALELNISLEQVSEALRNLTMTSHRLQLIRENRLKMIDDSYNASPDSMMSALEYLLVPAAERRIAVLADMNELGEDSPILHRQVGQRFASEKIDILITVGEKAKGIAAGADETSDTIVIESFNDLDSAGDYLVKTIKHGDVILFKGSRTMGLEKLVEVVRSGGK